MAPKLTRENWLTQLWKNEESSSFYFCGRGEGTDSVNKYDMKY